MARLSSIVFSLFVAACAVAAPMHRHQTGDLDCNLARLKIIFDVAQTQKLVGQINSTLRRFVNAEGQMTSESVWEGSPPPEEMRYARSVGNSVGLVPLSIPASSPNGWGR
ncbi:hypothetical protein C8R47DRAFT_114358 [Mycena vitilis]|nr:hypothetical protein C8R47DRAFT_114358 [Mycena vitilis]